MPTFEEIRREACIADNRGGAAAVRAADPMLAAGVMQALSEALAATFSSPEDWQQHLAEADARAVQSEGEE